ncbi:MAG: hypothetical protein WD157_01615 [Patescibacteria group bacterium]
MKQKLEQLNQSYKKALGLVLQKEYSGEGVIVEDVLLDSSMQHGRAWLICSNSQLIDIQKHRGAIQANVQKYLQTRNTPKIEFLLRDGYLGKMEELFEKVESELPKDEN